MRIFFAPGCPYAQRPRALLTLLDQPFGSEEVDLERKSGPFLALSPTGRVPLLEDDGFVLYESQVICEYLAERFGWRNALSSEVRQRARERLAMKQYDDTVVPAFFKALKEPKSANALGPWEREVESLGSTAKGSRPESLLGIHLATHWLRMGWVAPQSPVVLKLRSELGGFLDAAASLPSVQKTSPERAPTVAMMLKKFGPPGAESAAPSSH